LSEKKKKYENYLTTVAIIGAIVTFIGSIGFFLFNFIPSIVSPLYNFEGILGTIPLTYPWLNIHAGIFYITFPWSNFLTIFGLLLLVGGSFARLMGAGKKNYVLTTLLMMLIICLCMTAFGVQIQQTNGNNQPPPNSWYPTASPYPTYTYPPQGGYPTYTPPPTTNPTAFSITQLYNIETISGGSYYPPTSYRTVAYQPVIVDPYWNTHEVDVWGTFGNWNFDVYYKIAGTNIWHYGDSGITSVGGHGVAYIPLDSSMSRETFTVVAFIDPTDSSYTNYFDADVSDAVVANSVAAGTCRASNFLTFSVEVSYVL
jgi:hypothetical protein